MDCELQSANHFITNSQSHSYLKCAAITLDYKWNFTPETSHLIPELHERVADRMYNLFTANGGLYIKIGYVLAPLLFSYGTHYV